MSDYQALLRAAGAGLCGADGLAAAAASGAHVFEAIRVSAEAHAGAGAGLFAAWMMTAAEAADGRDALAAAASSRPAGTVAVTPAGRAEIADLARDLNTLMAAVLRSAAHHGDLVAWQRAAACAERIGGLTAGDTS